MNFWEFCYKMLCTVSGGCCCFGGFVFQKWNILGAYGFVNLDDQKHCEI